MKSAGMIILRIVAAGHPIGVNERLVVRVLESLSLTHTQVRVRAELRDLCDEGVVEIIDQGEDGWGVKATRQGLSLVKIAERSAGAA